jgi:uncharacterized protein (DUF3084 family)
MQGSIRQLITNLHSTNEKLNSELKSTKQKKAFLSTELSDARYSLREHKKAIAKLERKYNRLKSFRLKNVVKLLKFN